MKKRGWQSTAAYVGLLALAFVAASLFAQFAPGEIDNYAYDVMLRNYHPPRWQPKSAILAIDDYSLRSFEGGIAGMREPLARALRIVSAAHPRAVAIDLTLADHMKPESVDEDLADAMRHTPNLVLACDLTTSGWNDPLPEFANSAALGQVHAAPDSNDTITRAIPLEKAYHPPPPGVPRRRWALSLEAFRLYRGVPGNGIIESPDALQVGAETIPIPSGNVTAIEGAYTDDGRLMRVRFLPLDFEPTVSMAKLLADPSLASIFTGRAVFIGVTAYTAGDRLTTPVESKRTTGIEINAAAFETLANRLFITDVDRDWVWLFSLALTIAIGFAFRRLPGWWAYAGGLGVVAVACISPYLFFTHQLVFSFATTASVSILSFLSAGAYYHLVVRRNWRTELAARERYQQAMHFVTHEMRTPLSAIQGSSELISRFALTEEKRKQIALLINSESKRLARMVEIFLNVERLSAGQMELKRELIPVAEMIGQCVERVHPLAERKRITVVLRPIAADLFVTGDRELMEYACYNLLTNAVKYSPQRTETSVSAWKENGRVHIAVEDQGIGMDQNEVKQIFRKFYRTKKAEASGEAGTGIGLSIVQQIVEQHGGEIGVTSKPGEGSRFTMIFALAPVAAVREGASGAMRESPGAAVRESPAPESASGACEASPSVISERN
jgi:signal transduction histidine kinase